MKDTSAMTYEHIASIEETVQHKTDVLDWRQLDSAPCELEYRLHVPRTSADHIETICLVVFSTLAAPPLAALVGLLVAPWATRWEVPTVAFGLGIVLAIARQLAPSSPNPSRVTLDALTSSAVCFLIPVYVWIVFCATTQVFTLAGAFLFLPIAIPMAIVAADRIATHTVYWMTANGNLDHQTVQLWRNDWCGRFWTIPSHALAEDDDGDAELHAIILDAMRVRARYVTGGLSVFAAVIVPSLLVVVTNTSQTKATLGIQLIVGSLFGLSAAALWRSRGSTMMVVRYLDAVSHYLHYGKSLSTTPWMFHSPCGSCAGRRLAPLTAVALTAVATAFLSVDSLRQLGKADRAAASSDNRTSSTRGDSFGPASEVATLQISAAGQLLLTIASAIVTAPAIVLLIGFIMIAPLVHSFYEALET